MAKNVKLYKKGIKTKLTTNFVSTEFDCNCKYPDCQWTKIDLTHVEKLQELRKKLKSPIKITSGYRCEEYNKDVGGASKSRHKEGDASDLQVRTKTPDQVANAAEKLVFDGIGRYNTFTHLDSRGWNSRWDFRKK